MPAGVRESFKFNDGGGEEMNGHGFGLIAGATASSCQARLFFRDAPLGNCSGLLVCCQFD